MIDKRSALSLPIAAIYCSHYVHNDTTTLYALMRVCKYTLTVVTAVRFTAIATTACTATAGIRCNSVIVARRWTPER